MLRVHDVTAHGDTPQLPTKLELFMSNATTLVDRNRQFASDFTTSELPILPKLRTAMLTCGDARVDPAHVLGLELGDAVIIRNNGGRVTREVVHEIAALSFMVAKMDGAETGPFALIIMQHTHCGAGCWHSTQQ